MKVLVVGGGGREHALCWALGRSPAVSRVYCAPGNAGISRDYTCVNIAAGDIDGLAKWAAGEGIDLTVPGPEAPLVAGLVDRFTRAGLRVFGPCAEAALIEGSKYFAKGLMAEAGVPTARFEVFDDPARARAYVSNERFPLVVKADGLAAGKGVTVCMTEEEAWLAIEDAMEKKVFGDAGRRVIVEEFLEGEEATVMAFCDGDYAALMQPVQDHKRACDGDKGPNTGGMGAYSPVPAVTAGVLDHVSERVIAPVLRAMSRRGIRYTGVLYAGLMLTRHGPFVLEFNARFGDPETQAVLPRLETSLADIMMAAAEGNLPRQRIEWSGRASVCVVVASGGYPGEYEKGRGISGLDEAAREPGVVVFHAGTAAGPGGSIVTSGGRVLGVTATGETIAGARHAAYRAVSRIQFDGAYYRRDIGLRADPPPGGR
ncbi:MAG: phosphoribosylamine--glycine ligase [Ignavibacteriales bacterium]